ISLGMTARLGATKSASAAKTNALPRAIPFETATPRIGPLFSFMRWGEYNAVEARRLHDRLHPCVRTILLGAATATPTAPPSSFVWSKAVVDPIHSPLARILVSRNGMVRDGADCGSGHPTGALYWFPVVLAQTLVSPSTSAQAALEEKAEYGPYAPDGRFPSLRCCATGLTPGRTRQLEVCALLRRTGRC